MLREESQLTAIEEGICDAGARKLVAHKKVAAGVES
jgi:hypothetical protein